MAQGPCFSQGGGAKPESDLQRPCKLVPVATPSPQLHLRLVVPDCLRMPRYFFAEGDPQPPIPRVLARVAAGYDRAGARVPRCLLRLPHALPNFAEGAQ